MRVLDLVPAILSVFIMLLAQNKSSLNVYRKEEGRSGRKEGKWEGGKKEKRKGKRL